MPTRSTLDPYAVLGVPRDATPLQVARAHRRLAKRHHPDLHEGAEDEADRMLRINAAWSILGNPDQRADYDRAHPVTIGSRATGGHWAASRAVITPVAPNSTRAWASWRATAAETRAAPRTVRAPGETPVVRTRRPQPVAARPTQFHESGWAAFAAALVILTLLAAAIVAGRLAL